MAAAPLADPPSESADALGAIARPAAAGELRAGLESSRAGSLLGGLLATALLLILAVAGSVAFLLRQRRGRG